MNYHIIRSPESPGRPEKYIADAISARLTRDMPEGCMLLEHDCNSDHLDPENGADFYRSDVTAAMMGMAATAVGMMADGDVVLIMDAQSPISATIRYLCLINGITVKLAGLFHSSVFTFGDMFYGKRDAVQIEKLTLQQLDLALVATLYLAENLLKTYPADQIKVVKGLPMEHVPTHLATPAADFADREAVCVWPHRVAEDKGMYEMFKLAKEVPIRVLTPTPLSEELTDQMWRWGVDVKVCETREQYFQQLAKAKVVLSTAHLETFGYAMMEGAAMGCIPFVPDRACYTEQYNVRYRYPADDADTHSLCVERLSHFLKLDHYPAVPPVNVNSDPADSTSRIVGALLLLGSQ